MFCLINKKNNDRYIGVVGLAVSYFHCIIVYTPSCFDSISLGMAYCTH